MKVVYVVYDNINEEVISVHKTEAAAKEKCNQLAKRVGSTPLQYEYIEKEVER